MGMTSTQTRFLFKQR